MTPSTEWKEVIAPDEAARFEGFAERLRAIQQGLATKHGTARALHAKRHSAVEAEFTVLPDLPEYLRFGVFAKPMTYRAYARFSNGMNRRMSDARPDVRGVALKLLGVQGPKIIPGLENALTQDFLMIQTPTIPLRDAEEFVWFIEAGERPLTLLPRAFARFGFGRTFEILGALKKTGAIPNLPIASTTYFSALPVQFGPYAVKYALRPRETHAPLKRLQPDQFAADFKMRIQSAPIVYDFQVQFFVDEERTPIERANAHWDEVQSPFVNVATVTLPCCDLDSSRAKQITDFVETLSFDPWHALKEHRPLGSTMRARNAAYRQSTEERKAAKEPDGTEYFSG